MRIAFAGLALYFIIVAAICRLIFVQSQTAYIVQHAMPANHLLSNDDVRRLDYDLGHSKDCHPIDDIASPATPDVVQRMRLTRVLTPFDRDDRHVSGWYTVAKMKRFQIVCADNVRPEPDELASQGTVVFAIPSSSLSSGLRTVEGENVDLCTDSKTCVRGATIKALPCTTSVPKACSVIVEAPKNQEASVIEFLTSHNMTTTTSAGQIISIGPLNKKAAH